MRSYGLLVVFMLFCGTLRAEGADEITRLKETVAAQAQMIQELKTQVQKLSDSLKAVQLSFEVFAKSKAEVEKRINQDLATHSKDIGTTNTNVAELNTRTAYVEHKTKVLDKLQKDSAVHSADLAELKKEVVLLRKDLNALNEVAPNKQPANADKPAKPLPNNEF